MNKTKQQIKDLWKLCFDDSDEFIELYFRLRYSNEVNITIESGEEVIAALQMLPYPMTFGGREIVTAYVSGACTHPDYRNRGVMHELLSQAFVRMLRNGMVLSTLIPAEPRLFSYYARHGYAPVFKQKTSTYIAPDSPMPDEGYTLKTSNEYKAKTYDFLNRKLKERSYGIQHTEEDFRAILADLRLSEGCVYTLCHGGDISALAMAYPASDDAWRIEEIVADSAEAYSLLLQSICRKLEVPSVEVLASPASGEAGRPFGMARIIHAKAMLQLYASIHPETEVSIHLTDEQISANNGYYYLSNGKCMMSAKRLPGSHLALTIGELTANLFEASNPSMSLMLN